MYRKTFYIFHFRSNTVRPILVVDVILFCGACFANQWFRPLSKTCFLARAYDDLVHCTEFFGRYHTVDQIKRIEFQHRGSPHCHVLFCLANDQKTKTTYFYSLHLHASFSYVIGYALNLTFFDYMCVVLKYSTPTCRDPWNISKTSWDRLLHE